MTDALKLALGAALFALALLFLVAAPALLLEPDPRPPVPARVAAGGVR